ncbi:retinoblastoma-related protein-like isoform X2 [Asparagus officinalis]|uniref:retinoblastoma-related protein-like isoform X2 n=1 Tax=Asparagus officinalis TaxID=4686 RepID=UPI00098E2CAA|nr:retinoblastoma-related protein-like isoform X2 [Asparagus officinalis]
MSPGTVAMEGAKPSSSQSDGGESMALRFVDLCKGLDLDVSLTSQGMSLFKAIRPVLLANLSSIGSGSPEEVERIWLAFILYCVTKLGKSNHGGEGQNRIKLFQILKAAKLNTVDFFREASQFSLKAGPILSNLYSPDWDRRLELAELQAVVIQLNNLCRFYKRAYLQFFLVNDTVSDKSSAASGSTCYISDYHQFGWLLFLALRIHASSPFKDLVTCTNALVSVLAILILHVPKRFRSFSIDDSSVFVKKSGKGVDLLASLSHVYNTSEDDLRRTLENANKLIEDILKKKPQLASECKAENLYSINTDGLTYFDDLLDEKSLEKNLLILEKDYDDAINAKGELDERISANEDDSSVTSQSLLGGGSNISGAKRFDALASPAKTITSPCLVHSAASPGIVSVQTKMVSGTPVSAAMTMAKWLRTVISPLPSKPSAELEHFFSLCNGDVTSHVIRRANVILEAIFPSNSFGERLPTTNLMDNTWAEERKSEALKLYYRVLETICKAESKLQNGNNLPSLLSNERFHRCMLACSAELVLATHNTVIMIFPAVLERTGITAFDLSKVIENFVRHEETLPRELKRHLNSLEERLLESMAWEKGSSMYNSLIIARPSLSAEIDRLKLLAEPMPSLDAIGTLQNTSTPGLLPLPFQKREASPDGNGDPRSPKRQCTEHGNVLAEHNSPGPVKEHLFGTPKSKLHLLQSAFASPARPNPAGGGTYADTEINVFFRKILKLVAIRIKTLCERLKCSEQFLENVYWLIQQILNQRTTILFNRHIDQVILCSIYGVAKVSQISLTFKEIINNYRKQPQSKPEVFRSVFVNCRNGKMGEGHVDIITFYNEVFVPSVKPLLVEVGPDGIAQKNSKLTEEKNNSDGQIPGSPRLQPFPSLPDMSPKKVSASHNVYVSPLRQSKKDALLSPSSKSYYACVGESTHAYQSPSKDLTAINNRLNCGRKINARLNFDVVSDSVVAGSLGQQHGGSASSAAAGLPPKSEQPDT